MILDLHKTAGFSFDKKEKEIGLFDDPELQNKFYSLWEEFARRYSKYENMMCFELLNEVTDQSYSKKWNAIAKSCIEHIRKIAPTIKILVGSYWNNSISSVKDLDPPYDENIVYNFLMEEFKKDETAFDKIFDKINLAARARLAAKLAKETILRKNVIA